MRMKKLALVLLAGTAALLGAGPVFADDDDWKERRKHERKTKREVHHHHYYYSPPVIIYRNAPAFPPAEKPAGRASPAFPIESMAERSLAWERQREILEKELATEQQLLAEARLQQRRDSVEMHERNIEGLRRELKNVER